MNPRSNHPVEGLKLSVLIVFAAVVFSGCAARAPESIEFRNDPPCNLASGVAWASPKAEDDRAQLSDWCQSVGAVIVTASDSFPVDVAATGLIVLTWNQHEDYGDLERLLRSHVGKAPVVALLQEVARASDSVPLDVPMTVRVPRRIGPKQKTIRDIAAIAHELNMSLAYLPSMPNGSRTREDRGCAIISTLPMSDVVGIELPWVSQRRVAVMATVTTTNNGVPFRLRLVSMHLDNRLGRWRQAGALADFLRRQAQPDLPTLIGGDLNAWHGVHDKAVREINRVVPLVRECGEEPTFRFLVAGLRLDHLFSTLRQETRSHCFVEKDRFGSDHHPIVLRLFQ